MSVDLDRLELGAWPTPLQKADRLSEALGVPIYIKREDMSGVGAGGNKIRKLAFQLAHALAEQATCSLLPINRCWGEKALG